MIRLGLTGGIGAGKSTVAKTFVERGAYIIDADKIAREVVEPGTEGLEKLVEAFGSDILSADGSLDRPALAAKAFVDEESRKKLNAITHPLIGARTQELLEAAPEDAIVVQDIPLLVENHTAPFFHLVVIVHADEDVRLHRLTTMRGVDEADARARIAAQATEEQRRAVADVWLDNSGTPEELAAAAAEVWTGAWSRSRRTSVPDAPRNPTPNSSHSSRTRMARRPASSTGCGRSPVSGPRPSRSSTRRRCSCGSWRVMARRRSS